jgi:lysophospholipase L1-like esterase
MARRHGISAFIYLLFFLVSCSNSSPQLSLLPEDAVILAFGDSITSGVGAPSGESYPEILQGLINRKVIRSGIPGETSGEGLTRLANELTAHKPKLVLLCLGGNDLLRKMDLKQTATNMGHMIQIIRESGAEVLLIGVPKPGLMLKTADFYAQISKDMGVPLEGTLLADILSDKKLKADPIHPNGEGYRVLAKGIAAFLRTSGAVP